MTYTIEQMREWPEVHHRWVVLHQNPTDWKTFLKTWRAKPRSNWPGVYCIWSGEDLLYVGYSQDIQRRIAQYNVAEFAPNQMTVRQFITKFTALKCASPDEAAALESELIWFHRPQHNRRREPKGGQVRRFGKRPRSRGIAYYYGGR